jgi:hypothetical protein
MQQEAHAKTIELRANSITDGHEPCYAQYQMLTIGQQH